MTALRLMFKLNDNPSKQEEFEALRDLVFRLRDTLPTCYLASLLNHDLLNWFKGQMTNDLDCNLVAASETNKAITRHLTEQRIETLTAQLNEALDENIRLHASEFEMSSTIDRYTVQLADYERILAEYQNENEQLKDSASKFQIVKAAVQALSDK